MYAITAIAFNHKEWFHAPDDLYNLSGPNWTKVQSWPCSISVPSTGDVPRAIAAQMLDIAGIDAKAYGAFRSGKNQISAYVTDFWNQRRLAYNIDKGQLHLFARKPILSTTMTLMHARAGYHHDSFLNALWAVMVDAAVVGCCFVAKNRVDTSCRDEQWHCRPFPNHSTEDLVGCAIRILHGQSREAWSSWKVPMSLQSWHVGCVR